MLEEAGDSDRVTQSHKNASQMMRLRAYQSRIVSVAAAVNTVAVLPTGAGKTLIAAELIRVRRAACPQSKSLFLVPTCLLVSQQAQELRSWTQLEVGEYMGGIALPQEFDVLVSTPKAFEMAQRRGEAPSWPSLDVVIFDEVHHVLKEHPYRKLATSLRRSCPAPGGPRVLGLTASVTYAVDPGKVEASMRRLCEELQVQKMELASEDELRESGYHAFGTQAEVMLPKDAVVPGVVIQAGVLDPAERKPHLMMPSFFRRVSNGEATQFSIDLMRLVRSIEREVGEADRSFVSPLDRKAADWGKYAYDNKGQSILYAALEHWYEALRLLVVSWEEAADASIMFLQMTHSFDPGVWSASMETQIDRFCEAYVTQSFPRFYHLKDVLMYKLSEFEKTPDRQFRGIIFVQQRVMTHIIEHVIDSDCELSASLRPVCIYAQSSPATPSFRISKKDVEQRIQMFASGKANVLICTVVAEEGMDIPAANCVIRFDPVQNAVSFNQGRGRARQEDSSFVIMSEQQGRSAAILASAEQQQLAVARKFQPSECNGESAQKDRIAQQSREQSAKDVLTALHNGTVAALHLYCKKTKVDLNEQFAKEGSEWVCTLSYQSVLRDCTARGLANGKKAARLRAAADLIQCLRAQSST